MALPAVLPLRRRPAWLALEAHHLEVGARQLRDLFDEDPERAARLTYEAAGIRADLGITRVYATGQGLLVIATAEGGAAERAGIQGVRLRIEGLML